MRRSRASLVRPTHRPSPIVDRSVNNSAREPPYAVGERASGGGGVADRRRAPGAGPRGVGPGVVVDFQGLLGWAFGLGDVLEVDADAVPDRAAAAHAVGEDVGGM